MRKTNMQIWDEYENILKQKETDYLNKFFEDKERPSVVYQATINNIEEIIIDKIYAYTDKQPIYYNKPTKKDISKLIEFINEYDSIEKKISLHYTRKSEIGTSSGAYKYSQIEAEKTLSFDKTELIPIQQELNEKYAPKEGFKACQYCRKQVPENTMVPYKIIFQSSRPDPFSRSGYKKFVDQKTYMYCSKECGIHDQMGHEG